MVASFPLMQLLTLVARQASAPAASRIKEYAVSHPWFSRHVVISVGRLYHVAELRTKMWTLALRQPRTVAPISDAKALESGSTLLGEAILFSFGAIIIIFEVNRQIKKHEGKKLYKKSQWMAINLQLDELQCELQLQQKMLDYLYEELRRRAPNEFPSDDPAPKSGEAKPLAEPSDCE